MFHRLDPLRLSPSKIVALQLGYALVIHSAGLSTHSSGMKALIVIRNSRVLAFAPIAYIPPPASENLGRMCCGAVIGSPRSVSVVIVSNVSASNDMTRVLYVFPEPTKNT